MHQALTITVLVLSGWAPSEGPHGITADGLRADVEVLSGDAMAGRETGEPGARSASSWIAGQFRRAGLQPLPGRDDLFLDFTVYRAGHDRTETTLELTGRGPSFRPGVDFRPLPFSGESEVEAPVVFAGYGITAPEFDHDDYAGLEVEDRIVVVFRHEPGEHDPDSKFAGSEHTRHSRFRAKADNAVAHGAAAMILVTDPSHGRRSEDLRLRRSMRLEPERPDRGEPVSIPLLQVSVDVAAEILGLEPDGLSTLHSDLDAGRTPAALRVAPPEPVRVVVASGTSVDPLEVRNVAGFLPGSDPDRRDDWIVIGAHHDHLGRFDGSGDTVFNGADDNASGTAAVVALAAAFGRGTTPPPRSLVFVTFTGEEKGLLGSRSLVAADAIPRDRTRFMLNLDMIGRNADRDLEVIGDGYGTGISDIVTAANRPPEVSIELAGSRYFPNSDHDSFYRRDVPFLFLFSGTHEDYHGVGDHADMLDYGRMERIVRMAYGIVDRIANLDAGPWFIRPVPWLGVRVQQGDPAGDGSSVVEVEPASRGQSLGLQVGDRIVAVDESEEAPTARRLADVATGARFRMRVSRGGREFDLEGQRPAPGFLGVSTEDIDVRTRAALDLGEHVGVEVVRVMADGPAQGAGILVGDILVSVDGGAVHRRDLRDILERIGAGETVALEIVRGDDRLVIDVTLGER